MDTDSTEVYLYDLVSSALVEATNDLLGSEARSRILELAKELSFRVQLQQTIRRALSEVGDPRSTPEETTSSELLRGLSSLPFRRALDEALRRPWEPAVPIDWSPSPIDERSSQEPIHATIQPILQRLLTKLIEEIWQHPDIKPIYLLYLKAHPEAWGARQAESQGVRVPESLSLPRLEHAIAIGAYPELEAPAGGSTPSEGSAQAISVPPWLETMLRLPAPGSRLLRMGDIVTSHDLLQRPAGVELTPTGSVPITDVASLFVRWACAPQPTPTICLGESGAGKSTMALLLAMELIEAGLNPVIFDLGPYRPQCSDPDFASEAWMLREVHRLIGEQGLDDSYLLILESLDELLTGLRQDEVNSLLARPLFARAPISFCRDTFFQRHVSHTQFARTRTIVQLNSWDRARISNYIDAYFKVTDPNEGNQRAREVRGLLLTHPHLAAICGLPLRLNMLVDLPQPALAAASIDKATLVQLYDVYLWAALKHEAGRFGSILSASDKVQELQGIAWNFFDEKSHGYSDDRDFTIRDLRTYLLAHPPESRVSEDERLDDLLFRSLLRVRRADSLATVGVVSFQHKSFQEFFVARHIQDRVLNGSSNEVIEAFRLLFSPEVSEFLKEFFVRINESPDTIGAAVSQMSSALQALPERGQGDGRHRIAKQQLAYYLGTLQSARARTLLLRLLDTETDPWIARGIAVGLAQGGDEDAVNRYVESLRDERDLPERPSNATNVGFHLTFFGDQPVDPDHPEIDQLTGGCTKTVEGLLYQLGTMTDRGSWRIDAYTLVFLYTRARPGLRETCGKTMKRFEQRFEYACSRLQGDLTAAVWPETVELSDIARSLGCHTDTSSE